MQYTQVKVGRCKVNLREQRIMVTYPDVLREGNTAAIIARIGKISVKMHDIELTAGGKLVVDENMIERL
ncbi:hypothetical protein D3C73_1378510 [compost metagenome]